MKNPPECNEASVKMYIKKYNAIIQRVEESPGKTLASAYEESDQLPYINPHELTQILRYHFKKNHNNDKPCQ